MKRQALTLLAIFFALVAVKAQDLYRQGFVVTTSNEKIHGLIYDKETARSPETIKFKENENAAPITYTSKEIKGFATSRGVYFESRHFQYDGDVPSSQDDPSLPKGYFTSRSPEKWATADCFLEVLVKGKFTLYKYHDDNDRIHFFILDDGKTELEELLYRPFKSQDSPVLLANESYKQQLNIHSEAKCNLKSRITDLPYREKNLTRLVRSINECYGDVQEIPSAVSDKIVRKRSEFGITAEVYVTNPTFIKTTVGYAGPQIAGGISYEIFSRKRPNRLSFYSELKLKHFSKHDTYDPKFSGLPQTGTLSHQSIKLTNMVRVYPVGLRNIFLNGGVVYGRRFNTRIDGVIVTDRDAADRFEFGFAAGLGKKFSSIKLSIEPRFEFNTPSAQKSFALLINKHF